MDSESSDILYHTPTNVIIVPTNSHHHTYSEAGTSRERKHMEHGHYRGAAAAPHGQHLGIQLDTGTHQRISMPQVVAAVQFAGAAQAGQCCARVAGALQRLVWLSTAEMLPGCACCAVTRPLSLSMHPLVTRCMRV
jgi:hypothetical protein